MFDTPWFTSTLAIMSFVHCPFSVQASQIHFLLLPSVVLRMLFDFFQAWIIATEDTGTSSLLCVLAHFFQCTFHAFRKRFNLLKQLCRIAPHVMILKVKGLRHWQRYVLQNIGRLDIHNHLSNQLLRIHDLYLYTKLICQLKFVRPFPWHTSLPMLTWFLPCSHWIGLLSMVLERAAYEMTELCLRNILLSLTSNDTVLYA